MEFTLLSQDYLPARIYKRRGTSRRVTRMASAPPGLHGATREGARLTEVSESSTVQDCRC